MAKTHNEDLSLALTEAHMLLLKSNRVRLAVRDGWFVAKHQDGGTGIGLTARLAIDHITTPQEA